MDELIEMAKMREFKDTGEIPLTPKLKYLNNDEKRELERKIVISERALYNYIKLWDLIGENGEVLFVIKKILRAELMLQESSQTVDDVLSKYSDIFAYSEETHKAISNVVTSLTEPGRMQRRDS